MSMEIEESSLQVRGEMQQIFKVLSKDEYEKMPFEGIEIAKSLSRLPFFRRFFDTTSQHFVNLCISQDAVAYDKGADIYRREGEGGRERYIYVVLEGRVEVSSEEGARRQLGVLRVFGQTEILFGLEKRRERVVAVEGCKVMRIKEGAVRRNFTRGEEIRKCVHFMEVNEYFKSLTQLEKMQVALSMLHRRFEKGSTLKGEGDKLEEVFFFIYGRVQVSTHISKGGREREFMVDQLEEFSTYGEYESTNGVGTCFKLEGLVAGAYYALNFAELQRENHRLARVIRENAIPYPSREELEFLEGVKSTLRGEERRVARGMR